jgi:hypothetical protein
MGDMQVQYNPGGDTSSLLTLVLSAFTGRGATIQVENNSDHSLFYTSTQWYSGNFAGPWPLQNDKISPGSAACFGAQSTGFMTGVEAWISFTAYYGDDPTSMAPLFNFSIFVDNPFYGSNTANAAIQGPYGSQYAARYGVGGGSAANFVYQLFNWQTPGTGGQPPIGGPQIQQLWGS